MLQDLLILTEKYDMYLELLIEHKFVFKTRTILSFMIFFFLEKDRNIFMKYFHKSYNFTEMIFFSFFRNHSFCYHISTSARFCQILLFFFLLVSKIIHDLQKSNMVFMCVGHILQSQFLAISNVNIMSYCV